MAAFPSRLKAFLVERMEDQESVTPHVTTFFEVVDADVIIDGLTTMCRFDMQVQGYLYFSHVILFSLMFMHGFLVGACL
jgi:hypothetical protein